MNEIIKGEYLVGGGIGCDGVVVYKNNIIDNEYLDDNCKQIYVDSYLVEECNNFCEKKDCIYTSDEMIRCGLYDPNSNSLTIDVLLSSVNGVECPNYSRDTNLEECICNMCDLKSLRIINANSSYTLFPECIINLPYLESLEVGKIKNNFYDFTNMFKYKLNFLRLKNTFEDSGIVADSIGEFVKLETLKIEEHFDYDLDLVISDSISNLVNLKYLSFESNFGMTKIPESIGDLKKLEALDLHQTHSLKTLPSSISDLKDTLKYIIISRSGLDRSYVSKLLPNTIIID